MSHALLPDVRTYIPIAPQANTLGESDDGQALYARHCPCQVLEVTGLPRALTLPYPEQPLYLLPLDPSSDLLTLTPTLPPPLVYSPARL